MENSYVNESTFKDESTTSFVVESAESMLKMESKTKTTGKILNKNQRAKRNNKFISSITKQNKWQKIRYLPSKLCVKRINSEKPVHKSKYKHRLQISSKHLYGVKKRICRHSDREEKNSGIKNIGLKNGRINLYQFGSRSCPKMLAKRTDITTTECIKDASTATVCHLFSEVETQTSYYINTSNVGTQTDYSVTRFSNHLKYSCHFCNKVYKGTSALEKHVKKHIRKFLEFYCKTCERSFENSTALANHTCISSAMCYDTPTIMCYDDVDLVNIPVYKCGNCDAQFLTEGCYNEHKSKVHDSQEKAFTCIFCTEVLSSESAWYTHLENHILFTVN